MSGGRVLSRMSGPMPQVPRQRTRSIASAVAPKQPPRRRLEIRYLDPHSLKASPIALRKPKKRQLEHLTQSLRKSDCVLPVLIDRDRWIVSGHGIVAAAKAISLEDVPTICLDDLSKEEARALRITINKIEEMSDWNKDVLKQELAFLIDYDLELATHTGFSSAEIDAILNGPDDQDDQLPEGPSDPVTRPGDIWCFEGGHRLGCLDALRTVSYVALMAGELAALAICDPPFNVRVQGHVTGRAGAREFAMASGEMTVREFTEFLATYMACLVRATRNGALLLQWMDWRHMTEMLAAGEAVHLSLLNLIVWAKTNPGMGSLWRSAHELCFVWKTGSAEHVNNVELGRNGRNRSNVWSYPGANAFSSREDRDGLGHVTPKNVAMIQDAILDVSRRGDIVLDCFAGSGTTLLAAHRAKRRGYGLELDPLYVDLAVRRIEARTKAPARLEATGRTFAETAAERGVATPARRRSR